MQGGSVSWKGGILEMRGEIGNARRSWSGGNVETRGKFRVKENWREKLKKIKIKVREEFAEGFGEGERKSGIKWKYAKEEEEIFARRHKRERGEFRFVGVEFVSFARAARGARGWSTHKSKMKGELWDKGKRSSSRNEFIQTWTNTGQPITMRLFRIDRRGYAFDMEIDGPDGWNWLK